MPSPLRSTGPGLAIPAPAAIPDPELVADLERLARCADRSSFSDEPYLHAAPSDLRNDVHPGRANLLRGLRIDPGWNVLELSPGRGSLTRHLGETAATVDAVEPTLTSAYLTRARTADLDGVEVYAGDLDTVPAVGYYDLIVVNDLLERAGGGAAEVEPDVTYLSAVARRLAPNGVVVVGIDNKLGVKYLAGAPDAVTGRPFGSLENVPESTPARTLSRSELAELFARSGLRTRILCCFPDHRIPRLVFDPAVLPDAAPELVTGIPTFPSPDRTGPRPDLIEERLVWSSLVRAGLAGEMANSFLIIATPMPATLMPASPTSASAAHGSRAHPAPVAASSQSMLWDDDLAGVFFSVDRRSEFSSMTRIEVSGDKVMLRRRRISARPQRGDFWVEPHDADFVPGVQLVDALLDTADAASTRYLDEWADLVRTCPSRRLPYDLVPTNLVVGPDDRLVAIDDEWRSFGLPAVAVLARGVLLLGEALASRRRLAGRWAGCVTFRDVVAAMGAVIGLDPGGSWITAAVAAEAAFRAAVLLPGERRSAGGAGQVAAESLYAFLAVELSRPDLLARHRALQQRTLATDRLLAESAHAAELAATAADLVLAAETRTATMQAQLQACQQELAASRDELRRQQRLTADARAAHELIRQAAAQPGEWAEQELERMRSTLSWQATSPLRWVRRRVLPRRARRGVPAERAAG